MKRGVERVFPSLRPEYLRRETLNSIARLSTLGTAGLAILSPLIYRPSQELVNFFTIQAKGDQILGQMAASAQVSPNSEALGLAALSFVLSFTVGAINHRRMRVLEGLPNIS